MIVAQARVTEGADMASTAKRVRSEVTPKSKVNLPKLRALSSPTRILLSISIVVNVIAAIVITGLINRAPSPPALPPSEVPVEAAVRPLEAPTGRTEEGLYYKGNSEAPVKVIIYSDFQCPACGNYFERLEGQLDKGYIESGKVQFIYHDLPLRMHPNAVPAAEAARCAGDQGKFWSMHDLLLSRQHEWAADSGLGSRVSGYADELGLNRKAFDKCFDDHHHLDSTLALFALAAQISPGTLHRPWSCLRIAAHRVGWGLLRAGLGEQRVEDVCRTRHR